jgi:archaeal type IV pilus assembly protein PilA
MKHTSEHAVSPVVGVMLMLVVTIIIAAVVSAFAGGSVSSTQKAPQAQIGAKYSITTGMLITHNGGDALPTSQLVFTIRDGPTFGSGVDQLSGQLLNKSELFNSKGDPMLFKDGGYNFSSFNPGDTLYIPADLTSCSHFQPGISPSGGGWASNGYTYTGSKPTLAALCIRNSDNVGKVFSLEVTDTKGNMISRSDVKISA